MKKYLLLIALVCECLQPVIVLATENTPEATSTNEKSKTFQGKLSLTNRTPLKLLSKGAHEVRVAYAKEGIPSLGILQHSKEGITWLPAQATPIKLPYKLDTLISVKAHALLQYGDSTNQQHPTKTDLFFINEKGMEQGRVVDRYGPQSNVVMAEDGYVAIAGSLLKDNKYTEIGLYSATGEKRYQTRLAEGRRANIAVPTSEGQRVVAFTTDTKDYLAHHRLEIFDSEGKKVAEQQSLGILQKAVAVANGAMFFVQAKNRFGLVNSSDGTLLWTRDGVQRLISPFGAATDPEGKALFLAAAEWDGIPKARYQWRIEARDVATGNEFARIVLPATYPSNEGRIFLNVTSEQIELLAGDERIVLNWRRP